MKRIQALAATSRPQMFTADIAPSRSQETESESSRLQRRRLRISITNGSHSMATEFESQSGERHSADMRINLYAMRKFHGLLKQYSGRAMKGRGH